MYRIQIESKNSNLNGINSLSRLVDGSDQITTKITPIDRNEANVEIEQGEYVFNPDKMTLHKALGKKHEKGGTPVNLPENSFIFSNYKDLAISKPEKQLFELNLGGTHKAKNNTPSKVLEKQIDINHHNKMVNILNANKHDDIAKTSAALMLQKNMDKLGQIAYIQEAKKQFPQGVPAFAQNSAPVYDPHTDEQISQSTQYMKFGGYVLPKFPIGGSYRNNIDQRKSIFYSWLNNSKTLFPLAIRDFDGYYNNPEKLQSLYATNPNYDDAVVDMMKREGMTNKGRNLYGNQPTYTKDQYLNGFQDNKFDWRTLDIQKHTYDSPEEFSKLGYKQTDPQGNVYYTGQGNSYVIPEYSKGLNYNRPQSGLDYTRPQEFSNSQVFGLPNKPNTLTAGQVHPIQAQQVNNRIPMTAWQQFNATLPLLQGLGVKTQYPYRQQLNPVTAGPNYMNSDAQLTSIDQNFNSNRNLLKMLNPNQAFSANAANYGQGLDARNQVIAQTNQQNQQISSQYDQNVANLYNQTQAQNSQFNKGYYDQTQVAMKNRDDYKDFFRNKSLSTFNQYLSENQALNNKFNMLNAGKQDNNGNNPYNLVSNGIGYDVKYNNQWSGNPLNIQTGSNDMENNSFYSQMAQDYLSGKITLDPAQAGILREFIKNTTDQKKKLGGKMPKQPKMDYRNLKITF